MLLREVMDVFELIDCPEASKERIETYLKQIDPCLDFHGEIIRKADNTTDFIRIVITGESHSRKSQTRPTLGIVGRLGGVGARPERLGAVSDADGAITVLAAALKLVRMKMRGDVLRGDVIFTTHICPSAPTGSQNDPPQSAGMRCPVDPATLRRLEVDERMDAILSVNATKRNEIINHNGFSISPTVKQGYILSVSRDLLRIMTRVTGRLPVTFPIKTADITPPDNGLPHINSIMQPSTVTACPVVGVATTTEQPGAGSGTGANFPLELESTARFLVEVAKEFGNGSCRFYDEQEFERLLELYGSMERLQTVP